MFQLTGQSDTPFDATSKHEQLRAQVQEMSEKPSPN